MKPCHGRDEGRNSQLEPQLHEEAPPEQPQSPFILMVGGGWVVLVLELKLKLLELVVIVKMMLGWEDRKRVRRSGYLYTPRWTTPYGRVRRSLPSPRGGSPEG